MSRFAGPILCLALLGTTACGGNRSPTAGPRALPPDSAALLAAALRLAQPAFLTQEEALASRLYASSAPRVERAPAPTQPSAAPADAEGFVIQVAAYRDWSLAESAANEIGRSFPHLEVHVDRAGSVLRVSVGGWSTPGAAQNVLPSVRSRYPDAWVRARASP